MDTGLEAHIKQLDIKPNSVLFVNADKVNPSDLARIRLPYVGYTVPIVFTMGPPEVALLTRAELVAALHALDNDQTGGPVDERNTRTRRR
jgi:hypothetical protein